MILIEEELDQAVGPGDQEIDLTITLLIPGQITRRRRSQGLRSIREDVRIVILKTIHLTLTLKMTVMDIAIIHHIENLQALSDTIVILLILKVKALIGMKVTHLRS